ncbi:MAG: hypothetical protein ACRYFS_11905 [Janthinobacterium lividum]
MLLDLFSQRCPLRLAAGLALACLSPSAFAITAAPPAGINGFSDPSGFTLNASTTGPDNQSAAGHGVPAISGGTLHLTTAQGVPDSFVSDGTTYYTFYGNERTSAFCKVPQNITSFTASFTYQNNGPNPNPQSFGPGDAFIFVVQNDTRGASALGDDGAGYGSGGDGIAIAPSAGIAYNLFTGFGDSVGPALVTDGDNDSVTHTNSSPVNLVSGDPIAVTIYYNGTTLSETLVDTVTHTTFNTSYAINLVSQLGSTTGYIGFTGGTGAAVEEQYISNFIFTNNVPAAPVNTGAKLVVTATASTADSNGRRLITVKTTNNGLGGANLFSYSSVTLNSATPLPGSPSPVPTTPNLLLSMSSQTNSFYFSPSPGTTTAVLHVLGSYKDALNATDSFTGSVRVALP